MTVITVRIDEETKKKMKEFKHINWSEIIRSEIKEVLDKLERKNLAKAVLINEKIRKKALEDWDSTEFIRKWREVRYGEGSG